MQFIDFNYYQATIVRPLLRDLTSFCPTEHRDHMIMQILHDLHCDCFSPAEKTGNYASGGHIAGTRDT